MDNFFNLFFSNSAQMVKVKAIIQDVARTDVNVLVEGESGSGKEAVSRAIHDFSDRCGNPFVKVNCAAIPRNLLESELFGYEKGAFTGAQGKKPGKFELADGGTIVLNEIGDMDFSIQAKLLQVLQDGVFSRLGGNEEVRVKTGVITTTREHLEGKVSEGGFREDLFYRINVVNIALPPLRERRDQIKPLSRYYLDHYRKKYRRPGGALSQNLVRALERYPWPGNIRELENAMKGYAIFNDDEDLLKKLAEPGQEAQSPAPAGESPSSSPRRASDVDPFNLKEATKRAVEKAEREAILATLTRTNWNRKLASRMLQVSYKALLYKIQQYGLADGGKI
jgi:transcriptional regulator with PAS, ATPase and Fis domain